MKVKQEARTMWSLTEVSDLASAVDYIGRHPNTHPYHARERIIGRSLGLSRLGSVLSVVHRSAWWVSAKRDIGHVGEDERGRKHLIWVEFMGNQKGKKDVKISPSSS